MSDATANIVMPWILFGVVPALGLAWWVDGRTAVSMTARQTVTLIAAAWLLAPLVAAGWICVGVFSGARALVGGVVEWKRELLPARAKKPTPTRARDVFAEAAEREVNEIAPSDT